MVCLSQELRGRMSQSTLPVQDTYSLITTDKCRTLPLLGEACGSVSLWSKAWAPWTGPGCAGRATWPRFAAGGQRLPSCRGAAQQKITFWCRAWEEGSAVTIAAGGQRLLNCRGTAQSQKKPGVMFGRWAVQPEIAGGQRLPSCRGAAQQKNTFWSRAWEEGSAASGYNCSRWTAPAELQGHSASTEETWRGVWEEVSAAKICSRWGAPAKQQGACVVQQGTSLPTRLLSC